MAGTSELGAVVLLSLVLVACDSTSPGSERLLRVQGEVLEIGQAPVPPLHVDVHAWRGLDAGDSDSAILQTDDAGRYSAELGPFPEESTDSLRVRVTQHDCEGLAVTELWRRDLAPDDGDAIVLPTLSLSYRLLPAEFGVRAICGSILTRSTPELVGDHASLALWIDDISDSVRGRWRLNHTASIGDDFGYFSGSEEPGRLTLQLRPTQPTPCSGLQLEIPLSDNDSELGAGELTGDCFVPSTTVRFFNGASLSEVLPPAVSQPGPAGG